MFKNTKIVRPSMIGLISSDVDVKSMIGNNRLAVVDQFQVEEFNLNDAGWPRNTIACLARCQTVEQYRALAERLVKRDIVSDKNQKLTLKERFAAIRPRSCQTPADIELFAQQVAKIDMGRIDDAYHEALAKQEPTSAPAEAPAVSS